MSEIDVTIGTNQEATQLIGGMMPGTVFSHEGSVFLKVNNTHQVQALYIRDASESLQEVGTVPSVSPWVISGFDSGAYGRVVSSATLDIQL
jgi:hypothetical protein